MKCFSCESEARAVCAFCGRAVCREHFQTRECYSGFGRKLKDMLFPGGSKTGVIVHNAIWCGECRVELQQTY
jgi:hypothetical protein